MTRRERLTRCYFQKDMDRPAVYSRTGFPPGDASYNRLRAYLRENTELKAVWPGPQLEAPFDVSIEPYSEAFQRRIEILRTPSGELRRTFLDSLKGEPGIQETFLVKSPQDAENFLSLPIPKIEGAVDSFFAMDAEIGDKGIVDISLGLNPGGFAAELCGSTNFALLSVTNRDVLHRLCERRAKMLTQTIKFLVRNKAGPFFSMLGQEYIVPPLHGPDDFRDFNLRYDKPIIDLIHEAGGRVHVHSHGSVKSVFRDFVSTGIDVLHPFEAPPRGDITACEAKILARARMSLEGNIQIHRMYEASPEEIIKETKTLIADAFDDRRGLTVSPTASPYIRGGGHDCFPRYRAMVETVRKFKE